MEWPKISIKWKIFHWCFSLAIGILVFNYWYTTKLVQRSAGHAAQRAAGLLHALPVVRARHRARHGGGGGRVGELAAAAQAAFAAGNDEAAKPVLAQVEQSLAQTIHPDVIILVDRHGDATAAGADRGRRRRARCARSPICARA